MNLIVEWKRRVELKKQLIEFTWKEINELEQKIYSEECRGKSRQVSPPA